MALLLITSSTAPALLVGSPAPESAPENVLTLDTADTQPDRVQNLQESQAPAGTPVGSVELITGQTVTISEENGTRTYATPATDVTMHRVTAGNNTYVFPAGTDFEKFDLELFNVDRILAEYGEDGAVTEIPIIVSQAVPEETHQLTREQVTLFRESMEQTPSFSVERELTSVNAVSGSVTGGSALAYERFAADSNVEKVHYDGKVYALLDVGSSGINAPEVRAQYGVDGTGVVIAVADSGIDETHPDLAGRVVDARDFTGEGTTEDIDGHGTHVAGIVAGDGTASDGQYVGVAPNATLLNARVLGATGGGSWSGVVAGVEWADKQGADVISMSLGGSPTQPDPLKDALAAVVANETTIIVAAGNSGRSGYRTIGTPGVLDEVLTIGASDDADRLADFSSRGPTPFEYRVKPDLVAPGVNIMSAESGTNSYTSKSGTSMATPMVSGAAALLLEERPNLTDEQLRSILTSTADPLPYDGFQVGSGRLNVSAAITADVYFNDTTVDFGYVADLDGDDPPVTRTVTLSNGGANSETFTVSADLTSPTGDRVSPVLSTTTIVVPAGETRQVSLSLDPENAGTGEMSGHVVFDGDEQDYRLAVGAFVERGGTMTITKEARPGGNLLGDTIVFYNHNTAATDTRTVDGDIETSQFTFTKPIIEGQSYSVISYGEDESTGEPIVFARAYEELTYSPTVTIDETDTVPVRLDTSRLTNRALTLVQHDASVVSHVDRSAAYYNEIEYGFVTQYPESATVHVSKEYTTYMGAYTLGEANDYAESPTTAHLDTDTGYLLLYKTTVYPLSSSRNFNPDQYDVHEFDNTYFALRGEEPLALDLRWLYLTNDIGAVVSNTGPIDLRDRKEQRVFVTDEVSGDDPLVKFQISNPTSDNWRGSFSYLDTGTRERVTEYTALAPPYHATAGLDIRPDGSELRYRAGGVYQGGPDHDIIYLYGDNLPVSEWTLSRDGQVIDSGTTQNRFAGGYGDNGRDGATYVFEVDRDFNNRVTPGTSEHIIVQNKLDSSVTDYRDETPDIFGIHAPQLDGTKTLQSGVNEIRFDAYSRNVDETNLVFTAYAAPASVTTPVGEGGWTELPVTENTDPLNEFTAQLDTRQFDSSTVHLGYRLAEPSGDDYVETSLFNAFYLPQAQDDRPTAVITVDDSTPALGQQLTFSAAQSTDDNGITDYQWTFGDGTTTTGETVTHTYTEYGDYTVQLSVTDTAGQVASDSLVVTVSDTTPPTASLTVTPQTAGTNEPIRFDASGSTDDNQVIRYDWDLDSDGTLEATTESPTVDAGFDTPGQYTATVTVYDPAGNTDSATADITITDAEIPQAQLTADKTSLGLDEFVTLDASGSTDNIGIESYAWDFDGDGTADRTTAQPTTETSYAAPGTYSATVTVSDAAGNTNTARVSLTVSDRTGPTADLSVAPTTVTVGETVTFDGTGSMDNIGIESYAWDFDGDGVIDAQTATGATTHTYATTGSFTPTLTVTDSAGNSATAAASVTVNPAQTLDVTIDYVPAFTTSDTVEVFATIENAAAGDVTATLESPAETKTVTDSGSSVFEPITLTPGTNTVTVTVTDSSGATATDSVVVVYDTTAPVIDSATMTPYVEVFPGSQVTVDVTTADSESGVASVTADGVALSQNSDGTWTGTMTAADTDGIHSATIAVTDNAGHTSYETVLYLVGTPTRE